MAVVAETGRVPERFANYKTAVESGKSTIEKGKVAREERYETFDSGAGDYEASTRFRRRESKGVLAQAHTWSTDDFESVQVLGEGSFGVVHLVRKADTRDYYALKQMNKSAYRKKNHRERIFAERDILAEEQSRWFVQLFVTFQDAENVYMVMEFLQGGDLIGHLLRKGKFSLEETKFYTAELLEALDTVHQAGFVHRDVKPDNIVLSSSGHLKLLDFGLCRHCDGGSGAAEGLEPGLAGRGAAAGAGTGVASGARERLRSAVGTPQYMAPEVYKGDYDSSADLWSLGIIVFECLVGVVPFHSGRVEGKEGIRIVRTKVAAHAKELPNQLEKAKQRGSIPPTAEQLVLKLLCTREKRLSAPEIRRAPFYFGVDFSQIHLKTPPIVPRITSPDDASHFDDFQPRGLPQKQHGTAAMRDPKIEWSGYEFDRDAHALGRPELDTSEVVPRAGASA